MHRVQRFHDFQNEVGVCSYRAMDKHRKNTQKIAARQTDPALQPCAGDKVVCPVFGIIGRVKPFDERIPEWIGNIVGDAQVEQVPQHRVVD